jgi:hypothetical protein
VPVRARLVRRLVEPLPPPLYVYANDRKKRPQYGIYPLGGPHKLIVLGHYLIGNGGIDTLDNLHEAYGLADRHAREGSHVLMEGKCMSDGVPQAEYLAKKGPRCARAHADHRRGNLHCECPRARA